MHLLNSRLKSWWLRGLTDDRTVRRQGSLECGVWKSSDWHTLCSAHLLSSRSENSSLACHLSSGQM